MTAAQSEPDRSDDPAEPQRGIAGHATGVPGMVERQIRQAQERGALDNLPGAGKPLRDLGGPHDENWWLRQYLLREGVSGAAFLPPALALRKEVEDLPERVRGLPTEAQVRLVVEQLNDRILDALRKPGEGPPVTVMAVDAELIVLGWRFARIARRSAGATGSSSEAAVEPTPETAKGSETSARRRPRRWRRN